MSSQSLLLDTAAWDIALDISGNIAVASAPYAIAQDAACEIKLFVGEAYYDTGRGVPYWQSVLGHNPPLSLVRAYMIRAALLAPGAVAASVYFTSWVNRVLMGQVQVTNKTGTTSVASF